MATFGEAVDLILTELARSDTSITVVTEREVRKAVEHYSPTRFWFNEARASFTASNTIYYPFSTVANLTHFVEIDQVTTTVGGGVIELSPESEITLNRLDTSGFTGFPTHYSIFAETMRLYPKPASGTTYQIDVLGTKRLATLSVSTDSNEWTDEALDLICARVSRMLSMKRFKDFDAAQAYQRVEDEVFARLIGRTERNSSTGKLKGNW